MHLTAEQDGIYRRLIDHYMETRQPLPDNDLALARIAAVSADLWNSHADTIRAFFTPFKSGTLHHKRCNVELERQDGRNRKQSEKGKLGALKRWKKYDKNQDDNSSGYACAIATPMPSDSRGEERTGQEKIKKEEEDCSPAIKSLREPSPINLDFSLMENCGECFEKVPARMIIQLPRDWQLPQKWGEDMEKLGHHPDDIVFEAEKFYQYWTSGKGAGKRRSVKGWRQSWGNWMDKSKEWKAG